MSTPDMTPEEEPELDWQLAEIYKQLKLVNHHLEVLQGVVILVTAVVIIMAGILLFGGITVKIDSGF